MSVIIETSVPIYLFVCLFVCFVFLLSYTVHPLGGQQEVSPSNTLTAGQCENQERELASESPSEGFATRARKSEKVPGRAWH